MLRSEETNKRRQEGTKGGEVRVEQSMKTTRPSTLDPKPQTLDPKPSTLDNTGWEGSENCDMVSKNQKKKRRVHNPITLKP